MKWYQYAQTDIFWSEEFAEDHIKIAMEVRNRQYEWLKQSICFSLLYELPPLKHFLGWTPMKEFISRCKPFIPMQRAQPFIAQSILSDDILKTVEQIQLMQLEHWKWIQKILQIPKDNIG